LSVDSVAVLPRKDQSPEQLLQAGGAKFEPMPCPGVDAPQGMHTMGGKPLCVRRILSMPASRIELWVSYRDANGNLVKPPPAATAVLRTTGHKTGEIGGAWPAIDIAKVQFVGKGPEAGAPKALEVAGDAHRL